jgi:Tat protein translocase TatB subunit
MFGMGMGELLLILVVALLVVGPDKLPNAARAIGKGIRDFRKHTHDLQSTLEQDEHIGEAVRELKSAFRDEPVRPPRPLPPRTPATPPPLPEPPAVSPAAGSIAKNEPTATPAETDPAPPRAKADG